MLELLLVFIIAVMAGIFSGLMPGIGGLVIMTISYPFLIYLDPTSILLFYIVLVSIDQYFNGITAIIFGLPGHSTAIPSVIEGHTLFKKGYGSQAVTSAAFARLVASIFSVLLIICLIPVMYMLYKIWNTEAQLVVLLVTFGSLILLSKNNLAINTTLFAVGLFLGYIGYDISTGQTHFTFGIEMLNGGIPTLSILTALFVIPMFVQQSNIQQTFYWPTFSFQLAHISKAVLLRSSFIGTLGGFVPGLSYSASSLLAYYTERYIQRKNYSKGNLDCLIAAEGSNNAGVFSQMVPLIFLGIPITASESLIYNMLEAKGFDISVAWLYSMFPYLVIGFLLSSILGFLLASKYINVFKHIGNISFTSVYIAVSAILLACILWSGSLTLNGFNDLLITFCLLPIGVLLRKYDMSPLLYAFFLHNLIFEIYGRALTLYF